MALVHSNTIAMFGRSTPPGDGSSPSPPSTRGLFIAPFRNRSRVLTEETVLVRNIPSGAIDTTMQTPIEDALRERMAHLDLETESVCSSLSEDSRKRFNSGVDNENKHASASPPSEIVVPSRISAPQLELPFSRGESYDTFPRLSIARVWTGLPSPKVDRPTAPKSETKCIGVPFRTIPPETLTSTIKRPSGDERESHNSGADSVTPSEARMADLALLGDRPQRLHRRTQSAAAYSVGSLVGQSSLVTAPTASSSCWSTSETSLQNAHVRRSKRSVRRRRRATAAVKEDLKLVFGRVATPIRRLTKTDNNAAALKRADGCLT